MSDWHSCRTLAIKIIDPGMHKKPSRFFLIRKRKQPPATIPRLPASTNPSAAGSVS
jgi:hypothetical protein